MRKIKQIVAVVGFVLFAVAQVNGQVVVDRTNKVSLDFTKPVKATVLPEVNWVLPRLEYTNSEANKVDIKANVQSKVPLKRVTLSVLTSLDEAPMATMDIPLLSPTSAEFEKNMYLADGQNYVRITAENVDGGIVSDDRSVIVGMDALKDAIAIDRKDYAVLFATDKYDNWSDLTNPIYDAKAIGQELEERYGFEVRIVENASQDLVFNTLREYAQKSYKPQDQLFVFFAGHGQYDETFGEGFVVARNSMANDPGKNSYISHSRLRNIIDNVKCQHIMLVMDVCFGGTFDPVLASSRSIYEEMDNSEFIVKKLSLRTRKYLTSGSKEYVPDGTPGSHSPFAVRMLEALKTSGGGDRLLTISEVNVYMQKLQTTPRFGSFGADDQGSEFMFIAR
ncbi:MAG: caspase family protein [Imperialibacter sp.]|uniref:caspase family protein n=1 Tax=Imperialibacter sp. TaxID=2038411 RepID=UPI0032ED90B0